MKNIAKNIMALSLAACVALGVGPALAEGENSSPANPPAMEQTRGGSRTDQAPQMPGNGFPGGGSQMPPQMPDGGSETSPELPDGQTPDGSTQATPQTPDDAQRDEDQEQARGERGGNRDSRQDQRRQMPDGSGTGRNRRGGRQDQQTPPELPDGSQTPPELPDGQLPDDSQTPPELPDGQTPPDMNGGKRGAGDHGGSGAPEAYSAASVVTESSEGASYASGADGENAVLVSGSEVTISGATVDKTGSSDGDSADFYGVNAAVLAKDGATLTVENAEVTSDGAHANGVFSYGEGTIVNVTGTTISTAGNNSGGLMTTGGATLNATDVTVSTEGNSSAAIRSDRGGGTVTVEGGRYDTAGVGSPAIYSTADITVTGAALSASSSEAVVIEGGNSVTLNDVTISGNDAVLNGQSTVKTNVLIYQSMSGDAAEGSSSFTMTGGSMTTLTGDMFHVTNVTTTISLSGVDFTAADGAFLSASADAWGRSGSNGGHVTLNLSRQSVTGDMTADAGSSLTLNIGDGSSYTGAVNGENSASRVDVTLDENASWTLTGDSYVTSFSGSLSQVNLNGYALYVNGEAA